ncbi:MAG: glycoside hydrolase family 172 protein [Flavitalea sp.]
MNKTFLYLIILLLSLTSTEAQTITTETLLQEITNTSAMAVTPSYTMKQASSYDRRSVSVDSAGWYANTDQNQFIREENINGRTEKVMMDADGPGAIVRFWLTTTIKPGKIRFYLDNSTTPAIETSGYDLMRGGLNLGPALLNPHSSYEENGKGGNTMYFPIAYQKHCKITLELPDSNAIKAAHYYQINYRTYLKTSKIQTFKKTDLETYRDEINRAEGSLWNPPGIKDLAAAGLNTSTKTENIEAGKEATLKLKALTDKAAGAIQAIEIKVTPSDQSKVGELLRKLFLKIEFDGEQTVWCPVGDFSGSGYGGKKIKSWYRDLDSGATITIRSRFMMPFKKTANISLVNQSSTSANTELTVAQDKWKWTANTMYFHTTYKFEENIRDAKWDWNPVKPAKGDTAAPIEWNFIEIKGGGVYVGNSLAVDNHMQTWYGEGDAKVWIDDDKFPSEFGTGLEDYYNTSWAPVVLYQTPFANAPRADTPGSFGHNTFTRTRNLDGVPFKKYFRYDLEMLSWDGGTIDAAAVIYWYGLPGARVLR